MVVTIKASQLFKSDFNAQIRILNSSIKAILKLVYSWICFLKYLQTVYLKLITTWHFPSMLSAELGNYNYCLTFCIQGWKSVIVILTNFNKKSHFKTFVYVSYDTIWFLWYAYISYDSWALTICRYDIELFTHDTIHIVRYWQLWL